MQAIIKDNKNLNKQFLAFSALIALIFLSSLFIWGQTNIENYAEGASSALIRADHLFKGKLLSWYDTRGFGMPLPVLPNLDLHPIFILSPIMSLRLVYSLFWMLHLIMAAFFFMKLCKLLGLLRSMCIISGFFYIFSMPPINYAITDDWSNVFVAWAMYPVIAFFAFRLVLNKENKINYIDFLLPLIIAFTIYNGHPSRYLGSFLILFLALLPLLLRRTGVHKFKHFLAIIFITSLLVLPRMHYMIKEMSNFPDGLIVHAQKAYTLKLLLFTNLRPFSFNLFRSIASFDFSGAFSVFMYRLIDHNARQPFIGIVYFVLASWGVVFSGKRLFDKRASMLDVAGASVGLCFILSLILSIIPARFYSDTVHPWLFRDEMIFFGIIAAAFVLQRLKAGSLKNHPSLIKLLLIIQVFHVLGYSSYLIFFFKKKPKVFRNLTHFFHRPQEGDKLFNWLKASKKTYGKRVLLSPLIEADFVTARPILGQEHFYDTSDLERYVGLNVVNGNFKGISMDRIYPSVKFTKGFIRSSYNLISNSSLLDLAGINWVLMKKSELEDRGSFPHLRTESSIEVKKGTSEVPEGKETWVLLHNKDAWSVAFMLSTKALDNKMSYRKGCGHQKFLCADVDEYLDYKLEREVVLKGNNGNLELSFEPLEAASILGLSTLYRGEWEAVSDGKKMVIEPLFDAFIGVKVPPGTSKVSLRFISRQRIVLTYAAVITFVLTFIGLIFFATRGRKMLEPGQNI